MEVVLGDGQREGSGHHQYIVHFSRTRGYFKMEWWSACPRASLASLSSNTLFPKIFIPIYAANSVRLHNDNIPLRTTGNSVEHSSFTTTSLRFGNLSSILLSLHTHPIIMVPRATSQAVIHCVIPRALTPKRDEPYQTYVQRRHRRREK